VSELCEHGYPRRFSRTLQECPYGDQLDGATMTDFPSSGNVEISRRGTLYLGPHIANKKALRGRTININGKPMLVLSFESCLIVGHDEGHCSCFGGSGLLAKEAE
jgi:hypothetical protein